MKYNTLFKRWLKSIGIPFVCLFLVQLATLHVHACQQEDAKNLQLSALELKLTPVRVISQDSEEATSVCMNILNFTSGSLYYTDRPYPRGIELQVTDDKGRALSLNEKGKELALATAKSPRKSGPISEQRPRDYEFPVGKSTASMTLRIDQYVFLIPGETYSVRVVWRGQVFRSADDRKSGANPHPIEIRSNSISIRTPKS